MKRLRKIATGVLSLAAAVLMLGALRASADSTTFSLNDPNIAISPFVGPYVDVTVTTLSSSTATVMFTSDSATSGNSNCTISTPCTYLMGDGGSADLNVNASSFSASGISGTALSGLFTPGPFSNGGSGTADGFGMFNLKIIDFDGFTHAANSISFTLTNLSGTWANASSVLVANALGFTAAAHIFVESASCTDSDGNLQACATGFAANGAPIPEPGTLALFGTGLLGVAGLVRRLRRSGSNN